MKQKIKNQLTESNLNDYVGGNQINQNNYISVYQEAERDFVVTHNADIKPVSYFTGRETELQELRQRIEGERKSVLVSGMGGIGKTHICRKLFEEYLKKHTKDGNESFRHIGYIEYDVDMDSSLQNCLKYKEQDSTEKNREAAWRELEYLASDGKLLLFVDNVNKPMGEDAGLRRLNTIPGAIVAASRRTAFGGTFEPYRIGFLSAEKCMEIYENIQLAGKGKKVSEEEAPDLKYIIEKLVARHTITVEFLAHLAETREWDAKRLRDELESRGFSLKYKDKDDKLVNIQESYEKLYDLSELTEAEQNILEAFSLFPYIPLATKTCNQWLLADAGASEEDDVLAGLYRKGWLQFDAEQRGYALHPVFAQFIYEKCSPKAERHFSLIHSCRESLELPESGLPFMCRQYLPFAENILKKINMEEDINQIMFINSVAYLLQYVSEYKKAEELYKKSIQISERVLGVEHPNTATSNNNLAFLHEKRGEYRKAQELYEKSIQIKEKVLGVEHPSTAASYNNLALAYERLGEHRKAQEFLEKSLRINETVLGMEHPDTAMSYNNLALLYDKLGEYRKAEVLYKKSIQIKETVLGEEHPFTATGYNNLAAVYEKLGTYKEAQELYEKNLRICETILGEEHPDTAAAYNNLAVVYEMLGEYRKAQELYKKSIRIKENVLGEEHPSTATAYNNLAGVYEMLGAYKKAEELFEKSLRIRKAVLGEEHLDTATAYNNLAALYERLGTYRKAQELFEKSLRIYKSVLGEEHPNTAISYNNLAAVYEKLGTYRKAQELFEKSLRIYKAVLGAEHPDTATAYNNLAAVYENQGEYRKAQELFEKSLQIREAVLNASASSH